jgi:hypothetical protein
LDACTLVPMIALQKEIQAQLDEIKAALESSTDEMTSWKLRRQRYELLRANGVKAKRTYPSGPLAHIEDFRPTHVTPINIRYHGGKSIGGAAVSAFAKAAA